MHLNYSKKYIVFSDWDKENISEPPPTKHISIEDLNKIVTGEKNLTCFIPKVMSHSIGKKHSLKSKIDFMKNPFFAVYIEHFLNH